MPARPVTSLPPGILWSTRLTRTVTGSSRRQSPHNASSSTSIPTLKLRDWTASKMGRGAICGGTLVDFGSTFSLVCCTNIYILNKQFPFEAHRFIFTYFYNSLPAAWPDPKNHFPHFDHNGSMAIASLNCRYQHAAVR